MTQLYEMNQKIPQSVQEDLTKRLSRLSIDANLKSMKISMIAFDAAKHSYYMGDLDMGFMEKLAAIAEGITLSIGRSSCTAKLNEHKKAVAKLIYDNRHFVEEANDLLQMHHQMPVTLPKSLSSTDYSIDNAKENESWYDDFEHCLEKLQEALIGFADACSDASDRLLEL